jgi:hypothetical protein
VVLSTERCIDQLEQAKQRLARDKKECQEFKGKFQQLEWYKETLVQVLQTLHTTSRDWQKKFNPRVDTKRPMRNSKRCIVNLKLQCGIAENSLD